MSSPITKKFFSDLKKSELIGADQFEDVRSRSGPNESPNSIVRRMVETGLLTNWQSRKLLQGSTEFYFGKNHKYKLLRVIGRGGMGVVFKAEHVGMGRSVALKVMTAALSKDSRKISRFLREIRLTAALDHPNIIRAYDADVSGGQYFLVMEYIRGRNLAEWMTGFKTKIPIDVACDCIRQAALGLQHAHEKGLVHRDIKPTNLLVTDGPNGRPTIKVLDLGLSRLLGGSNEDGGITRAGHSLGTADYMPPEQAESAREVDIRADIYSLGCTLFELLTGRLPYVGKTELHTLVAKTKEDAPRVRTLRDDIPVALEQVVARMLERHPDKRYSTPAEFVSALTAVTDSLTPAHTDGPKPGSSSKQQTSRSLHSSVPPETSDLPTHSENFKDTPGSISSVTIITEESPNTEESSQPDVDLPKPAAVSSDQSTARSSPSSPPRSAPASDDVKPAQRRGTPRRRPDDSQSTKRRFAESRADETKTYLGSSSRSSSSRSSASQADSLAQVLPRRQRRQWMLRVGAAVGFVALLAVSAIYVLKPKDVRTQKVYKEFKDRNGNVFEIELKIDGRTYRVDVGGMVRIPAGQVRFGEDAGRLRTHLQGILDLQDDPEEINRLVSQWDTPEQRVSVPSYWIDRNEVTNAQYAAFLRATDYPPPKDWEGTSPPKGKHNHPIVHITHEDATAYARWKNKQLPTSQQWLRAFRGDKRQFYPWGDEFDQGLTNVFENPVFSELMPVDRTPYDVSAFGVLNLAGNAREFVREVWQGSSGIGMTEARGSDYLSRGSVTAIGSFRELVPANKTEEREIGFRCIVEIPADATTE